MRIGIDDVRLVEFRHHEKPVAARHRVPIIFAYAFTKQGRRWSHPVAVVLQAAINVIRSPHIISDVIELREDDVVDNLEGAAFVVRDLIAAIAAALYAVGVGRVYPERLMVAVYVLRDVDKRPAAIV